MGYGYVMYISKGALRPSYTGNISGNNVALQVEIVCCAYCHLRAQQMFMLPKVKATSTQLQPEHLLCEKVVIRGINKLSLQRNTDDRQVARQSFPYYWAFITRVAWYIAAS